MNIIYKFVYTCRYDIYCRDDLFNIKFKHREISSYLKFWINATAAIVDY